MMAWGICPALLFSIEGIKVFLCNFILSKDFIRQLYS